MSSRYRSIVALLDDPRNMACILRELKRRKVGGVEFKTEGGDPGISWTVNFEVFTTTGPQVLSVEGCPWDGEDVEKYPVVVEPLFLKGGGTSQARHGMIPDQSLDDLHGLVEELSIELKKKRLLEREKKEAESRITKHKNTKATDGTVVSSVSDFNSRFDDLLRRG